MANFSKENYKRPQNTTIEKNPTVTNLKVPQAWEIKEGKRKGNWLYNHKAALLEVKHRGERLPTSTELIVLMKLTSGDCAKKAKLLNFPLSGCRSSAGDRDFTDDGSKEYLWTSHSEGDDCQAVYINCTKTGSPFGEIWSNSGYAFSVRSVKFEE